MIVARGMGKGPSPGTIVGGGLGILTLGGVIVSTFRDIINLVVYITRSVSVSLER